MIEAGVFSEEAIEHRAQEENSGTLVRRLVNRDRYLDSASDAHSTSLSDAPYNRSTVDVANSTDAALDGAIGHVGEDRKRFLDRFGIAPGTPIDEAEMVGRKQ